MVDLELFRSTVDFSDKCKVELPIFCSGWDTLTHLLMPLFVRSCKTCPQELSLVQVFLL